MRRIPRSFWASLILALALSPLAARGQTTQPTTRSATRDWPHAVQALAQALSGTDLPALQAILEPAPAIRGFASENLQTPERMMGTTTGSKVLGAHAYGATPQKLASDLAEDFRAAGDAVPEQARQQMIPPDEAAARRANDTAAEWVASVLRDDNDAKTPRPTGVIILWPADRKSRVEGPARRAIFVLVRGEKQGSRFVFRQIVFGDPLETPR